MFWAQPSAVLVYGLCSSLTHIQSHSERALWSVLSSDSVSDWVLLLLYGLLSPAPDSDGSPAVLILSSARPSASAGRLLLLFIRRAASMTALFLHN
jgi:hypothetical protein